MNEYVEGMDCFEDDEELHAEVVERLRKAQAIELEEPVHRLLGMPDFIQTEGIDPDSLLLFQIDEDRSRLGLRLGDCGRIFTIVGYEWLEQRAFEELVFGLVETS